MAKNTEGENELAGKIIIRKKNGYSIWADEFVRDENGDYYIKYTTKDGKHKKVFIARDQIAEVEEEA